MEPSDAAEWLLRAESDLTYAKLGQAESAILRNQVAFHGEQAAEKAFKAVLVHTAVGFPKKHDLQALLLLLPNSGILGGRVDRKSRDMGAGPDVRALRAPVGTRNRD
jgi:HEPN domain-containing protein